MRAVRLSVVAFGLLVMATPAWAGWIIEEVIRGSNEKQSQRMFLQANRLKTVTLEGTRVVQAVVMDLDAQTITHIDYGERAYTTGTAKEYAESMRQGFQAMGETGGQMQAQLKEMEEQLKQLPPEQRRQVEAMMKSMQQGAQKSAASPLRPEDCVPDKVEIKRTGKSLTVAGYESTSYQIFSNGKLDSEVWIAPGITAVREIDPVKLERMVAEMMKALPQCPPRGQMFGADPVWKLMKDGYPVRSVEQGGGTVIEVVKAESRALSAGEWQPPAGFARKSLKEMMGGK